MNHVHEINQDNEKKTFLVIVLTVVTMVAEIFFGYVTNSMALLADGFHMGTHAFALGLTFVTYIVIRKFSTSELFPCGTGKINALAAYTSSIFLGLTGLWIVFEAFDRLIHPLDIVFNEAILVAVIGLIVNSLCILIMGKSHSHCDDCHETCVESCHKSCDEDYNFKAAYYHILADALTSILAIIALFAGKYLHLVCFDAITGILGGCLILKWSSGLLKDTFKILTDMKN